MDCRLGVSVICFAALIACANALDVQHGLRQSPSQSKVKISVGLFSGRPNPTWETNNRDALAMVETFDAAKWINIEESLNMMKCVDFNEYFICDGKVMKSAHGRMKQADQVTVDMTKVKSIVSSAPKEALKKSLLKQEEYNRRLTEMFSAPSSSSGSGSHHRESKGAQRGKRADELEREVEKMLKSQDEKVKEVTGFSPVQLDEMSENSDNPKQLKKLKEAFNKLKQMYSAEASSDASSSDASSSDASSPASFLQESQQLKAAPVFDHQWGKRDNCYCYAANQRIGKPGVPGARGYQDDDKVEGYLSCFFDWGKPCRWTGRREIVDLATGIKVMAHLMTKDGFVGPMSYQTAAAWENVFEECHIVASYLAPGENSGDPYEDYHWIREDQTTWSHKGGPLAPVTLDRPWKYIPLPREHYESIRGHKHDMYFSDYDAWYVRTGYWASCSDLVAIASWS